MEHRGKAYTAVQGIDPHSWKWTVQLDEKTVKSGTEVSQQIAETKARFLIDKTLPPRRLRPPKFQTETLPDFRWIYSS
jgi:hypothetical protein